MLRVIVHRLISFRKNWRQAVEPSQAACPATNQGQGDESSWRQWGLTGVLFAGALFFCLYVSGFYPLGDWLFLRYAGYISVSLVFLLASTSAGLFVLKRLLRIRFPLTEELVVASAVGVLCFGLGWFILGALGLYSSLSFFAWPMFLLLLGLRQSLRVAQSLMRIARAKLPAKSVLHRTGTRALLLLGGLGLLLVYVPILSPYNVAYDARWYHLSIAEMYAVTGGLVHFDYGWFVGTYPHFASILYSWAFSIPSNYLFDHVGAATHLEFVLFLVTLAQVPVLVRRLLGGEWPGLAWVAMFVFPGLFLYDSGLSGAADHIAAFWAIPIYLVFLRAYRELSFKRCTVLALLLAGPLLTKYSAYGMVLFPSAGIAWRAVTLWANPKKRSTTLPNAYWKSPLLICGVVLVTTSPHWLKNLIFHSDPFYPLGHALFASRPWTVDTVDRFSHYPDKAFTFHFTARELGRSVQTLLTFSFVPNDWDKFHGKLPVFGSLFTLLLPCLIFLRKVRPVIALYACAHVAILFWYWTYHQDRYLQTYLPWMAACVAAIAIRTWRTGFAPRIGLFTLVGLQLVWGGDVPFFPSHSLVESGVPHKNSIDLLSTGFRELRSIEQRFDDYGLRQLRQALPEDAVLLMHNQHLQLGTGVKTISDGIGWQGGLTYGRSPSPGGIYDKLRSLSVTHLAWKSGKNGALDSVAGDIGFFLFAVGHTKRMGTLSGLQVAEMPTQRPADSVFHNKALLLTCGENSYQAGLYRVTDLTVSVLSAPRSTATYPSPRTALDPRSVRVAKYAKQVDVIINDRGCRRKEKTSKASGFTLAAVRGSYEIWVRDPTKKKAKKRSKRKQKRKR